MGNRVAKQVHPAKRDELASSEAEDEGEETRREVLASNGRSCWKAIAGPCSYLKRVESERRENEVSRAEPRSVGGLAATTFADRLSAGWLSPRSLQPCRSSLLHYEQLSITQSFALPLLCRCAPSLPLDQLPSPQLLVSSKLPPLKLRLRSPTARRRSRTSSRRSSREPKSMYRTSRVSYSSFSRGAQPELS